MFLQVVALALTSNYQDWECYFKNVTGYSLLVALFKM